ncbi:hypothetical protein WR25_00703 [Diploscapter pachys]|uniref:G-protein coupled receptors family 1 profile domain-containing protein n=1 Tax=Diploscapter pachys TaxID=2018661 RepID=A0A2A2LUC2_9BILA|nr:hypothetical protein WR25_00703 [Diploscapter pachys]
MAYTSTVPSMPFTVSVRLQQQESIPATSPYVSNFSTIYSTLSALATDTVTSTMSTSSEEFPISNDSGAVNDSLSEILQDGMHQAACSFHHTPQNYLIIFVFIVIFLLSVIGNLLVILVIIQQRAMRSITNIYLMNLAVTDLLLSVVCMPPTLVGMVIQCWPFGDFACRLLAYLQPAVVSASAYTLAVIAFERYFAICRPLHSRIWQTRSHAYLMISCVWIIAFLANIQILFQFEQKKNGDSIGCINTSEVYYAFLNQIYMTVVLLVIPLLVMTILYGQVICSLHQGIRLDIAAVESSIVENDSGLNGLNNNHFDNNNTTNPLIANANSTQRSSPVSDQKLSVLQKLQQKLHLNVKEKPKRKLSQMTITGHRRSETSMLEASLRSNHHHKNMVAKKRVINMLIVIVIIFFICWTPNYIFWLIVITNDAFPMLKMDIWNADWNTFFTVLTYLSSCTNPITYCFLNQKFRQAVYALFGRKKILRQHFQKIYLPMIRDKSLYTSQQFSGPITFSSLRNVEKIQVARCFLQAITYMPTLLFDSNEVA